ncbi:S1/P1 Nuclease [Phenylobacterium sp.]|jgi:hypothetical protein|uniref:S1/P1 Nuclease n=1 Tax=Phenylobacterium sp. TaxID=1871053 RepID=UPI002F95FDD3
MKRLAAAAVLAAITMPQPALAWGATGHRLIGEAAVRGLPAEIPAFLRTRQAALDVGEQSREPDRSKGAGKIHDQDRDAAHFVDTEDDGRILGGPRLDALPPTRADYEKALQAAGQDSWKAGYLPYAIADRWQQLTRDFAMWRVLKAAETNPKWKKNRAWFTADRLRREKQILVTLGELSHFVADGSQPLHLSNHYNGWGDYPNPQGFTTARIHSSVDTDIVLRGGTGSLTAAMSPLRLCNCSVEARTRDYLLSNARLAIPLYELEKAGGLKAGDPRGPAFARKQMALGASELRDVIVEAWRASETQTVGWRPIPVKDVLSGKTDPYAALYGID